MIKRLKAKVAPFWTLLFFLAEFLPLTVHPSTLPYMFQEEINTSNFKRSCEEKWAPEMCANKELFKKGHAACNVTAQNLLLKQKRPIQTHLVQIGTRVSSNTTKITSSQTSLPHSQSGTAELDSGCNCSCISYSAVQSRSTENEGSNEVFMRCGHAQEDHQKHGMIWCRVAGEDSQKQDVLKKVKKTCTTDWSTEGKLRWEKAICMQTSILTHWKIRDLYNSSKTLHSKGDSLSCDYSRRAK